MPGAQGPKTVKVAQSDPNYVSRLLLDCVPVFHKIITPAYLLYRSGPVAIYYSEMYSLFYGSGHTVTSSLLTLFAGGRAKIIVTPLTDVQTTRDAAALHGMRRDDRRWIDANYPSVWFKLVISFSHSHRHT